jgi:hypothetical protein
MSPATVGAILETIAKHWTIAPNAEVTLEANPTSVEADRFRGYRAAGVNRVSLGVQALDDASLKELGRLHTAQEALDAVKIARRAFEHGKLDLALSDMLSNSVSVLVNLTPLLRRPTFTQTSIVNGASFLTGPLAPGEIVAILGSGLGPEELTVSDSFATTLAGTRVFIGGVAAPLLYVSSTQIGAVVPFPSPGTGRPADAPPPFSVDTQPAPDIGRAFFQHCV